MRHILLFADAADAEEPGTYRTLVPALRAAGITVSVIGMGGPRDSDAELLRDVARLGGGRISFAQDVADMPRLFAQETMLVARSAWAEGATPLAPTAQAALDLPLVPKEWPGVDGYNVTWLRPTATALAEAIGDPRAPAVARWRCGAGRSAVLAIDAGSAGNAALRDWPGFAPLVAGLVRWCAQRDGSAPGVLGAERFGDRLRLRLDLDPARRASWPTSAPTAQLIGDGAARACALTASDDGVFTGWVDAAGLSEATLVPAVAWDGHAVLGPALCRPYPSELAPRLGEAGAQVLARIVRHGGGALRQELLDAYDLPGAEGTPCALAVPLLIAALVLLLLENAWRRLRPGLPRLRVPRRATAPATTASLPATAPAPAATPAPEPPRGDLSDALDQLRRRRR